MCDLLDFNLKRVNLRERLSEFIFEFDSLAELFDEFLGPKGIHTRTGAFNLKFLKEFFIHFILELSAHF